MKRLSRIIILAVIITMGLAFGITAYRNTKLADIPMNNKVVGSTKNVVESTGQKVNASIGIGEGKSGDNVIIAVNFDENPLKGVDACDFKIKYDPAILEASEVTFGDIVVGGKENFSAEIETPTGVISFLFMDNTFGKQAILKNGVFANISFKLKKDISKGNTPISLKSIGAFVDEALHEHKTSIKDGSINIK